MTERTPGSRALSKLVLLRRWSWAGAGLFAALLAFELMLFPHASTSEANSHDAASCGCISHSEDKV